MFLLWVCTTYLASVVISPLLQTIPPLLQSCNWCPLAVLSWYVCVCGAKSEEAEAEAVKVFQICSSKPCDERESDSLSSGRSKKWLIHRSSSSSSGCGCGEFQWGRTGKVDRDERARWRATVQQPSAARWLIYLFTKRGMIQQSPINCDSASHDFP